MRVPHGCKSSPVKEVHVKIPEEIAGVSVTFMRDWKVEVKMRKLDKPVRVEGTTVITETVDEIIWKEPKSPLPPSRFFETFQFRVSLPNDPGRVIWFKSYNVCEDGDDKYVEVPKEELRVGMPDFKKKFDEFEKSVGGPAPFVILIKPERPQYPWDL